MTDDGSYELIPEDISVSFSGSDRWVSRRLPDFQGVFPNSTFGSISKEMEGFYCCLCIGSAYGDSFEEEFSIQADKYDFKTWTPVENVFGEKESWENLYKKWIELGSVGVRMLASACSYKLKTEKTTALTFRTSGLPGALASDLESLRNKVKRIRLDYEDGKLSPDSKTRISKLEIKFLNKLLYLNYYVTFYTYKNAFSKFILFKKSIKQIKHCL